jgi:hypothetical protein
MSQLMTAFKRLLYPVTEKIRRHILIKIVAHEKLYSKYIKLPPEHIAIEITNICNARCIFCPYVHHIDNKSTMSNDMFKKIIDQFIMLGIKDVDITSSNGEVLLDKNFHTKIEYAKSNGISRIGFVTNGILLNRGENCQNIVNMVDWISISIPPLDNETYLKIYGVNKCEDVIDGIIKLAKIKREQSSKLQIELWVRLDRPLEDTLSSYGMLQLKEFITDGAIIISKDNTLIAFDSFNGTINSESLIGSMQIRDKYIYKKGLPCKKVFNSMAILENGMLRACSCRYFLTKYDDLIVGNIADNEINEIIFGPSHKQLLQEILTGSMPSVCKSCTSYEPVYVSWKHLLGMAIDLLRVK